MLSDNDKQTWAEYTRAATAILLAEVPGDEDVARLQALDLRLRASWLGRMPADPLSLGFGAVAIALGRAEAAGADEPTRKALALVTPEILPANATPFERGLTMGLALALLTEGLEARPLMTEGECAAFAYLLIDAAGLDIPSSATAEHTAAAFGAAIHQAQTGRPDLPGEPEPWPSPQLREVIERVDAFGARAWTTNRHGELWRGGVTMSEGSAPFEALGATPHEALEGALALARSAKGAA